MGTNFSTRNNRATPLMRVLFLTPTSPLSALIITSMQSGTQRKISGNTGTIFSTPKHQI